MWNDKYPVSQWIIEKESLKVGDRVVFFSHTEQAEMTGRITEEFDVAGIDNRNYLFIETANDLMAINFYTNIVYKLIDSFDIVPKCSCGAKYTSSPKYHLSYCEGDSN